MTTKIIDVAWFNGRTCVGIVKVEDEYDGIKYYIGSTPFATDEETDMKFIADWGAKFPKELGDQLFGVV